MNKKSKTAAIHSALEFPIDTTAERQRREYELARYDTPMLLSSAQVAIMLGLTVPLVYALRRAGELVPAVKLGSGFYYHRGDVRRYGKRKAG